LEERPDQACRDWGACRLSAYLFKATGYAWQNCHYRNLQHGYEPDVEWQVYDESCSKMRKSVAISKKKVSSVKLRPDITTDNIYINLKNVRASSPKAKLPGNTRQHDKTKQISKDPPRYPIHTRNSMSITSTQLTQVC